MKEKRASLTLCFGAAAISLSLVLGLQGLGWLDGWDRPVFDAFLKARGANPLDASMDSAVSVVAVTNRDVMELNQPFPWPRSEQSVIFEKLAALEPSVVGVDLLYTEAGQPADDARLAFQLAACEPVVGAFYFDEKEERAKTDSALFQRSGSRMAAELKGRSIPVFENGPTLPIDVVGRGMTRVGHTHIVPDPDGVVRRIPLLVTHEGRLYPSLALQILLTHWDADWSQVSLEERELRIVGVSRGETLRIPVDDGGGMILSFAGASKGGFEGVSVMSLMQGEGLDALRGDIVCVGSLVTGHGDVYATSFDSGMPGLQINAEAVRQILRRDFVRNAGATLGMLGVVLASILGAVLCWWLRPLLGAIALAALVAFVVGGSYWLLDTASVWLAPTGPVLAALLGTGLMSIGHYQSVTKQHRRIVRIFSRYVGPNIGKILSDNPEAFEGGAQRLFVTVFFSDIVDYTRTSEKLASEELVEMLNRYFDSMAEVAFQHEATISKYIGDGMMAFFNAPVPQEDHVQRAVRMSAEMQEALGALNEEFAKTGLPRFEVRMGIHSGYAHVGNIGSVGFTDFTLIGSAVNLAARIADQAGPGEIFVSERSRALCGDAFTFESLGEKEFKGVAEPVGVHQLVNTG